MTVDVNSGSATKEKGIEDTAFRVNMEAAPEIARQLRLRDLGGIIVIDFIDMTQKHHKLEVERAVKTVLRTDRAKSKILRISALGLLELSRQRLRSVLGTGEYTDCPMCDGQGRVKSPEMAALSVFRKIKSLLIKTNISEVRATVPVKVGEYLLNSMRAALVEMEIQYGVRVTVTVKEGLPEKDMAVEAFKEEAAPELAPVEAITFAPVLTEPMPVSEVEIVSPEPEPEQKKAPKSRQRRRRGRKKTPAELEETIVAETESSSDSRASFEGEPVIENQLDEPSPELEDVSPGFADFAEETAQYQTHIQSAIELHVADKEFETDSGRLPETDVSQIGSETGPAQFSADAEKQAEEQEEMRRNDQVETAEEADEPEPIALESGEPPLEPEKKETKEKSPRKSLLQSYLPFS